MNQEHIIYKEWLPDLPAIGNPGLTEATNVLPVAGSYKNFTPHLGYTATALSGVVPGAFRTDGTAGSFVYAGDTNSLYRYNGTSWDTAGSMGVGGVDYYQFAQYEELVFVAQGVTTLQSATNGSAAFATITAAPIAKAIGVVGQFVMVGNLVGGKASSVRWPAIDDPTNWPTPGSATAIAAQAGEQQLATEFGEVMAIQGGDQFGLIFQENAITRATYVGGTAVFQFDRIAENIGCWFPNSVIAIGGKTYFISKHGIYVTDGVQVIPLGQNKIDKSIVAAMSYVVRKAVTCSVDKYNKVIGWGVPLLNNVRVDRILWHSYDDGGRFTLCNQDLVTFVAGNVDENGIEAFDYPGEKLGAFNGSAATNAAVLSTGLYELNSGGYAHISGVKSDAQASTSNAITGAIISRDTSFSYITSGSSSVNLRSQFADFRYTARYTGFKTGITGTFNSASAIDVLWAPAGRV